MLMGVARVRRLKLTLVFALKRGGSWYLSRFAKPAARRRGQAVGCSEADDDFYDTQRV